MDSRQLNQPTYDVSQIINRSHPHSYMFSVWLNKSTVEDMRTAESYAVIAERFESAITQLRHLATHRQVERCPECGRSKRASQYIQVRYWVMTGDDVLFQKNCYVRTLERAIKRLDHAAHRVRNLKELPKRCGTCKGVMPTKSKTIC